MHVRPQDHTSKVLILTPGLDGCSVRKLQRWRREAKGPGTVEVRQAPRRGAMGGLQGRCRWRDALDCGSAGTYLPIFGPQESASPSVAAVCVSLSMRLRSRRPAISLIYSSTM